MKMEAFCADWAFPIFVTACGIAAVVYGFLDGWGADDTTDSDEWY